MKQFSGYDDAVKNAKASGGRLPAGAYVCKVVRVAFEEGKNGNSDMIQLLFDIEEGEHKGFFKSQFDNNTDEDKKWKGKTTIYVPKDDGTEKDEWTKNSFAKWTTAFELSNPNYKWDWKEEKWKGLLVGIIFGDTGTVLDDGKEIVYTEARTACDIEAVRKGTVKPAKFKAKRGYTGNSNNDGSNDGFMSIPDGVEEEIPY